MQFSLNDKLQNINVQLLCTTIAKYYIGITVALHGIEMLWNNIQYYSSRLKDIEIK